VSFFDCVQKLYTFFPGSRYCLLQSTEGQTRGKEAASAKTTERYSLVCACGCCQSTEIRLFGHCRCALNDIADDVDQKGHVIFFNIFYIPDLEIVRIDTKINFVSLLFRKYHNYGLGSSWTPASPQVSYNVSFYTLSVEG